MQLDIYLLRWEGDKRETSPITSSSVAARFSDGMDIATKVLVYGTWLDLNTFIIPFI